MEVLRTRTLGCFKRECVAYRKECLKLRKENKNLTEELEVAKESLEAAIFSKKECQVNLNRKLQEPYQKEKLQNVTLDQKQQNEDEIKDGGEVMGTNTGTVTKTDASATTSGDSTSTGTIQMSSDRPDSEATDGYTTDEEDTKEDKIKIKLSERSILFERKKMEPLIKDYQRQAGSNLNIKVKVLMGIEPFFLSIPGLTKKVMEMMGFSSRYRSRHKCDHKGPKGNNRKTTPMPLNQFQDVLDVILEVCSDITVTTPDYRALKIIELAVKRGIRNYFAGGARIRPKRKKRA